MFMLEGGLFFCCLFIYCFCLCFCYFVVWFLASYFRSNTASFKHWLRHKLYKYTQKKNIGKLALVKYEIDRSITLGTNSATYP